MIIVYKFGSSCPGVLDKKYLFWKVWNVFTKTLVVGFCFNKIARPVTILKWHSTTVVSWESFCYLWTAASVISLYLHRYLHIFPTHFHLNHSKSNGCSQVYIIIGIYHVTSIYHVTYWLHFRITYLISKHSNSTRTLFWCYFS